MPKKRNAAQIGSVSGKAALSALLYLLFMIITCTILLIHRNYVGFIVQYPARIVNAWEQCRCWSGQQDDICILHG